MKRPTKTPWQRKWRMGILWIAGLIVGIRVLAFVGNMQLPGRLGFGLLLLAITLPTHYWWAWIDEQLSRPASPSTGQRDSRTANSPSSDGTRQLPQLQLPRRRRRWRILMAIYAGAMLLPVVVMVCRIHWYDRLPIVLLMGAMVWHLSMAMVGAVAFVIMVIAMIVRGIRHQIRRVRSVTANQSQAEAFEADHDATPFPRRSFLTGALAAAPMVVAASSVIAGVRQQGQFQIRHMQMVVPRLPARLDGLTITHLTDFHVGRYFQPKYLPHVVDVVNRLNSDLIAITGDIVDHSIEFLPAACDAFEQMESRYGRYVIVGNHDLIDSPDEAMNVLRQREPNFLADEHVQIDIGGETVQVGGLFWMRFNHTGPPLTFAEHTQRMLTGADPGVFTLALAHHPHAFDALAAEGVDVVLAGHTHGGQVMLTPQGSARPIGGGSIFRYIWGEYTRGRSIMNVSAGVGNWFPIRINAPAEIVQIRLIAT